MIEISLRDSIASDLRYTSQSNIPFSARSIRSRAASVGFRYGLRRRAADRSRPVAISSRLALGGGSFCRLGRGSSCFDPLLFALAPLFGGGRLLGFGRLDLGLLH